MKKYTMENLPTEKYIGNKNYAITYDDICFFEKIHEHDYYEIEYIYEGDGIQIIDDMPYNVKIGDIVFLPPDHKHSYYSINDMKIVNACFSVSVFAEFTSHLKQESKVLTLTEDDKIVFENIIFLLENELRNNYAFNDICQSYLSIIVSLISRNNNNLNNISEFWQPIISYIALHYNTVTLDEVCKISHISKNYFCKKFKSNFGLTFIEYLSKLKIQRAKQLLLLSERSITEIMTQVGYTNSKLFYKNFNIHTGTTPRNYRIQNRRKQNENQKINFSNNSLISKR